MYVLNTEKIEKFTIKRLERERASNLKEFWEFNLALKALDCAIYHSV